MAYRFQYRGDKESNWKDVILADREIGLLLDEQGKATNLYKIGDGQTKYQDLPYFGFDGSISSKLTAEENENTDLTVLNKKVVIDEFANISSSIDDLNKSLTDTQSELDNIKINIGARGEGDDIYTELDNIKINIGAPREGDSDIYTELDNIKLNIGADEKGNRESIYKEIGNLETQLRDRHKTIVLSSYEYSSLENNLDLMHEDVLYFVYDN